MSYSACGSALLLDLLSTVVIGGLCSNRLQPQLAPSDALGGRRIMPFNSSPRMGWSLICKLVLPAYIKSTTYDAVRKWKWARIARKHPRLMSDAGASELWWTPIMCLLRRKCDEQWTPKDKACLRNALADRQWPQLRLFKAGLAKDPYWRLCNRYATGLRCAL